MRLSPGDRLGPYEIRSPIGAGGMGEVYRAHDTRLGRDVAVKVLGEELVGSPEASKRFEREARAVASVSHPNIVSIFEFEIEGNTPIVVTELLEGQTLRRESRMPWQRATEIAASVADGLAAAHARRIIHRDLKPDNIFLTTDGRVKILDFGIAHVMEAAVPQDFNASDETPTAPLRRALGTVGYAAPEQLTAGTAAPSTDIFSLGVVLYELLTGMNPFQRPSSAETVAAVLHEDAPPMSRLKPHVPEALERIIRHCLEKNPEQRFQSASDLAYRLREVLREAETPAIARLSRWQWVTAAATAIVIVAVAAAVVLYRPRVSAESRPPITSMAILPLANTTHDPNFDYVSDGITDSLINQLSALPNVRITARPTVFQYKSKVINPVSVGKELGVAALATGRVDLHGNNIVIAADLIDAKSGAELWGNTYRRARNDINTLPGEIASAIADELRVALTAPQQARIQRAPTTSPAAFDLYLRGVHALNLTTKSGLEQAITYLQKAVATDPDFARAWSALAETYTLYSRYADPHVMRTRARDSLEQALRIDPDLAEAHVSSGLLHLWDEWNFRASESDFRTAIALNPNLMSAHLEYSNTLRYEARFDEAIREARAAVKLDPLGRGSRANLAHVLIFAGQPDAAIAELKPLLRTDNDFADAHYFLGSAYEQKGLLREACDEYVRDDELAPRDPREVAAGRKACATGGLAAYDRQKLEYYLTYAQLKEPVIIASFYLLTGDKEQAYAYLERAYEARSHNMVLLKSDPVFKSIRNEPRFRDLMKRVGFDSGPSEKVLMPQEQQRGQALVVKAKSETGDSRQPEK